MAIKLGKKDQREPALQRGERREEQRKALREEELGVPGTGRQSLGRVLGTELGEVAVRPELGFLSRVTGSHWKALGRRMRSDLCL